MIGWPGRWKGSGAKECGQPLEAEKREETDSRLELSGVAQPFQRLDVSPGRPILGF